MGKMGRNEKGVALIVALMLLLVLTIIGISAITTTSFESIISGNDSFRIKSFYAAEAGLEQGLNDLPPMQQFAVSDKQITLPRKKLDGTEDSYYSTKIELVGLAKRKGYASEWEFKRYKIDSTGDSSGSASQEVEAQLSYGPFKSSTEYNN